eukprot:gene2251-2551_t
MVKLGCLPPVIRCKPCTEESFGYFDAGTGIRAANLSGDCKWTQEIGRGNTGMYNHLADCAKRRAIKAVEAHPKCKSVAESAVLTVWDKCNADYSPFTTIPK